MVGLSGIVGGALIRSLVEETMRVTMRKRRGVARLMKYILNGSVPRDTIDKKRGG